MSSRGFLEAPPSQAQSMVLAVFAPLLTCLLTSRAQFSVEFGAPTLVGSSNTTHFWFPASVLQLGADTAPATERTRVRRAWRGHGPPRGIRWAGRILGRANWGSRGAAAAPTVD